MSSFLAAEKPALWDGPGQFQNLLASDHSEAYTSMLQPLFGDVC